MKHISPRVISCLYLFDSQVDIEEDIISYDAIFQILLIVRFLLLFKTLIVL